MPCQNQKQAEQYPHKEIINNVCISVCKPTYRIGLTNGNAHLFCPKGRMPQNTVSPIHPLTFQAQAYGSSIKKKLSPFGLRG